MSATRRMHVLKHEDEHSVWAQDEVICEHAVALVFNGVSHAVMMATPADLEDFGLGFALSEGVIDSASDCHDIDVVGTDLGTEVRMRISARAFTAMQTQRRAMAGRTGCGLCGIDSLRALAQRHPASILDADLAHAREIAPATILQAFAQLQRHQPLQADTGGCHAAAWADAQGRLLAVREDVGRHNALDKLIGHLARTGCLTKSAGTAQNWLLMSSRASYELVSKCARVGIPALAAISAPTSLAVELARATGVALYGFCRGNRAVHYTPPSPPGASA